MKILITGGCGFLGSNLASFGIKNGYDVTVFDNLSRTGTDKNLEWLNSLGKFTFIKGDITDKDQVEDIIKKGKFDGIFHLAGQVAMTTSLEDPYKDFLINTCGTLNVLNSIKNYSPNTAIFYSSTNKVYGDLEDYDYKETDTRYVCTDFPNGFDESIPLNFMSPYGCSKGAADQYMLDFHKMFDIKATVFRHSSMYGSRQFATYDQGWIGWFVSKAIEQKQNNKAKQFTISGDGKQVRDILHCTDMINLYYKSLENAESICGEAYNIGGTMDQSLSLLELFDMLNSKLSISLNYDKQDFRKSDQKVFVANIDKINNEIDWYPKMSADAGISEMIDWVKDNKKWILV